MDVWKMPTGLCTVGENIGDAAEREVMEETGVEATMDAVLSVRYVWAGNILV